MRKRVTAVLGALVGLVLLVSTWLATAGPGGDYQQDCRTVYVDGVKCTGCSRCYEPRRVGTDESGKIPPWEFRGEGWSEAERAIGRISISSELRVNSQRVDSDASAADNASYVHTSGYATGGDWWDCVYRSHHVFKVHKSGFVDTEAGWTSKGK